MPCLSTNSSARQLIVYLDAECVYDSTVGAHTMFELNDAIRAALINAISSPSSARHYLAAALSKALCGACISSPRGCVTLPQC